LREDIDEPRVGNSRLMISVFLQGAHHFLGFITTSQVVLFQDSLLGREFSTILETCYQLNETSVRTLMDVSLRFLIVLALLLLNFPLLILIMI